LFRLLSETVKLSHLENLEKYAKLFSMQEISLSEKIRQISKMESQLDEVTEKLRKKEQTAADRNELIKKLLEEVEKDKARKDQLQSGKDLKLVTTGYFSPIFLRNPVPEGIFHKRLRPVCFGHYAFGVSY
jgi:hypothetical protein